jgi:hypothetical protein
VNAEPPTNRPRNFEERFRLYLDESGDHVFNKLDEAPHRFLCLLGCWFKNPDYLNFHASMEAFKRRNLLGHPDEPAILHREDILNKRRYFGKLCDPEIQKRFNDELLELITQAQFRLVAVVIDKERLHQSYGDAASHPYHLAMGFMLQRYCGYLNHINRVGDVMAESRGGREDRLLKDSYSRVYDRGVWMDKSEYFQHSLTSKELKVKPKVSNVAGLQLADLLGHPVKQEVLREAELISGKPTPFADNLLKVLETKWNQHLYDGKIKGYGKVLFPK